MQYLKESVRGRIVIAAITEFKLNGFSNASIRNIADNAGISLGNIYRYYENKEDLYLSIVTPFMNSIKEMVENGNDDNLGIMNFIIEHSDEFLIIRKGAGLHYNEFVTFLVEVISKRFDKFRAENKFSRYENPQFSQIVASGFLHALFQIVKDVEDETLRRKYISELMTFYFSSEKV